MRIHNFSAEMKATKVIKMINLQGERDVIYFL